MQPTYMRSVSFWEKFNSGSRISASRSDLLKVPIHKHNTPKTDPKVIESRQFKNFDSAAFIDDIKETPFHLASLLDDPNEMWLVWKSLFLEIANKHAPIRKRKVKSKSSPWISSELRQKMRKRDSLKKQAVKLSSHQMWNDYKKARNDVNASIRD